MNTRRNSKVRACVVVFRKNRHAYPLVEFMGDETAARHIGTVVYDLEHPPFKHRTTERETLSSKADLDRLQYVVPSREPLGYIVQPNYPAIAGALREHEREQDLDSPAWYGLIQAIRRELS